jgi:hypothetical protein
MIKLITLLREYPESKINSLLTKWGIDPKTDREKTNVARRLINRFDQIKTNLSDEDKLAILVIPDEIKNRDPKDIDLYSFEDLEKLINSYPENPEKIKKEAARRFTDKFDIDRATALSYVSRFMANRDKLKFGVRDGIEELRLTKEDILNFIPKRLQQNELFLNPLNWNWNDFEQITDSLFPSQKKAEEGEKNTAETDADKVYDADGIEIYKGDDVNKCFSYNPIETTGIRKYGFCIASSKSYYDNYRFRDYAPTFYFVFDRNRSSRPEHKPFDDKWHVVVIHVNNDGKSFSVTSADNDGDVYVDSWEDIPNIVINRSKFPADLWNKIKGLKKYFKPIPLSSTERGRKYAAGKDLSLSEFKELSQDEKILYIQGKAPKNQLSDDILKILPKYKAVIDGRSTTLANIAVDSGQRFSYSDLKNNELLAKRYAIYRFRHTNYGNEPIPLSFIKYLNESDKEKYLKTFDEDNLSFEYIEKYFGEKQAQDYVDKQIKKLDYLPPSAIKYIKNPKIKELYETYTKLFSNWKFDEGTNISEEELENEKTMPGQGVNPEPILYDDWKRLSPKDRQITFDLSKLSDSDTEKYKVVNFAVPIFLQDGGQTYALLPTDKDYINWVIVDMDGNIKSEFDSVESIELKNTLLDYRGYSHYDDKKRTHNISDLKINDEPVSLREVKRLQKLAGIIKY